MPITIEDYSKAYEAAMAAERAYKAELVRLYGQEASDARFDIQKKRATPELAELHQANLVSWEVSLDLWHRLRPQPTN